ncbi:Abi family protein [Arthrobacter glacialis]|uniref:Abi family protein n=1 Tax=Arthrobacter glacialis TaxID=1664 RepID=A0A2S3ZRE0_ARTGL|nr:Abi family protein [Arthrobacter glacialis]POH71770.1 hypothetical protein CVS27_19335 [Arthrobacter glacialis]
MPIWALTEILEMGLLGRLYAGLNNSLATEIVQAYGAPTKKLLTSWISCLNYIRIVSAHHARLFNRKLVAASGRPKPGLVPALDHLQDETSAKKPFLDSTTPSPFLPTSCSPLKQGPNGRNDSSE